MEFDEGLEVPKNGDSLEAMAQQVKGRAAEKLKSAKKQITGAYDRTAGAANRAYDGAVDYSRQNPGTIALVALGAGVGLGMLLARIERPSSLRHKRSLPAMAGAVAEAVLDAIHSRRSH